MARAATASQRNPKFSTRYVPHILVGVALLLILYNVFVQPIAGFPEEWNIGLRAPLDEFKKWVVGHRATSPIFVFFFEPVSNIMDLAIRNAAAFLLWLPWPVVAGFVFILGNRFGGLRLGAGAILCLLFIGWFGLWDAGMETLALMVASVTIALLIGIPLGIWIARSDSAEAVVRPVLDGMQTMPAFVYLIPVVLFFGIGAVPAAIAAVIYAVPPVVRLTNLGLRRVAEDMIEAAQAFGSTSRQMLFKIEIPQALPSILAGVNQTIMMALSIVIIAALVGAGGLGDVVIKSLRRLNVGVALEAGLAIVLMAILLDRLSQAIGRIDYASQARHQGFRLLPARWQQYGWANHLESAIDRVYQLGGALGRRLSGPVARHAYWWLSLAGLGILALTCFGLGWVDFPEGWYLSLAAPVNAAVKWAQVNLYEIGATGLGTGPFSDFTSLYILAPLRKLFGEIIPWPALILLVCAAVWNLSGWGLATLYAISMLFIGLLGMWDASIDTFTQVVVAVAATVAIGVPLGVWAARSRVVERVMRPILDFLQTIPSFVYLVPVIMLFNVGRVPGIIASVLYALPPQIRLTVLGIRQVDEAAVEAAQAFGSTDLQMLRKVQFPLALPQIMLGVNQAIMMVLSMVIIAGMVGAAGLGLEVVDGMQNNRMGQSVEAGLAIVIVAIMVDRLTQALARRAEEKANLHV